MRTYPDRPIVGVGAVIFRDDTVLLIRRGRPPMAGALSFPGGRQRLGETAIGAARRELREETGVGAGALVLAAHVDAIHRDPAGMIVFHYTILDFAGAWVTGEPNAASDAAEAFFAPLADLATLGLDADHRDVIARARLLIPGAADFISRQTTPGGRHERNEPD